MSWITKGLIIVGVVVLLGVLIFIIKKQNDAIQSQQNIEKSVIEMKQLADNIVRSQSQYATRQDVEDFAKQTGVMLGPIRSDLQKLGAKINAVSSSIARSGGTTVINVGSSSSTPSGIKTTKDLYGYLNNQQHLSLEESFANNIKVPWGSVGFSAWQQKPWNLTVYPRDYHSATVIGVDENDRQVAYNQFWVESQGKRYDIQIADSKFVQQYPVSKFRFSFRPFLGVSSGVVFRPTPKFELMPELSMSIFSYGKTNLQSEWVFLQLGAGYESQTKTLGFSLSPIGYNLGELLSFIHNVYIEPSLGIDIQSNFSIMMGLKVGL